MILFLILYIQFFKGEESALTVSNCQKIIKDIIQGYENDTKGYEIAKELESSLHQRWNELGINYYHSDYINEEVFRSVYSNNRLDIFPLISLITHGL